MVAKTIRFFDAFSGVGGFREGLTRAGGFSCVGHCEIDKYAEQSYRLLFDTEGEWYCDDARKMQPDDMPDFELLCGGFPCQAFSVAGKRAGFADPRGTLFFEIARLAQARRPAYLLLENVPGLLTHDQGRTFSAILATLNDLGYRVEWMVLNSADFRVPQVRKRVFIVGYLDPRCAGKILPVFGTNGKTLIQILGGSQGYRVYDPRGTACTQTAGGGGKGVKSIAGLAYSLFLIVYMVLPAVFSGYSPILMSIICGVLSTAVTLLLLNGNSEKTWAAILSTVIGVICSLLFFLIMSLLVHIDGFSSSEAEGLVLISQETGLQIKDVLFAGVLISSLGAIMDTGMSIVSALYEVYTHNPGLGTKELFLSGIEMGKDMIGTMTNTLILAFTGSAFITLLVFLSYQVQADQLFNSNYLTIEIAQGICGTFGIVLTVPVASAVTAAFLARKKNA